MDRELDIPIIGSAVIRLFAVHVQPDHAPDTFMLVCCQSEKGARAIAVHSYPRDPGDLLPLVLGSEEI